MSDDADATVHEPQKDEFTDVTVAHIAPLGDEVMRLLAEHVPLALLADLAAPSGSDSTEILRTEGLPEDAWWESSDATPAEQGSEGAPSAPTEGKQGSLQA